MLICPRPDMYSQTRECPPSSASDHSGSTSATPNEASTVTFGGTSQRLVLINDGDVDIQLSMDDGSTWFAVMASEVFGIHVSRTSVSVKSAGISVPYRLVVTY